MDNNITLTKVLTGSQSSSRGKKAPIVLLGSVKGGSSKTYNTLALAIELTKQFSIQDDGVIECNKRKVCVIDLDLSATNMVSILDQLRYYANLEYSHSKKKTIHQYIIESASQKIVLDQTIVHATYPPQAHIGIPGTRQIDFILGTDNSRIRNLFSESRTGAYENSVHEHEARILLIFMIEQVLERGYGAIVIDMQPGMEGLCHATMEYFSDHKKEFNKLYEVHLCMCSTNDMTQLGSNLEWIHNHLDLCNDIPHRHLLIRDNADMIIKQLKRESDWESLLNNIRTIFKRYELTRELDTYFQSITLLAHNQKYLDILCSGYFFSFVNSDLVISPEDIFSPYNKKLGHSDFAVEVLLK